MLNINLIFEQLKQEVIWAHHLPAQQFLTINKLCFGVKGKGVMYALLSRNLHVKCGFNFHNLLFE